MGPKARLKKNKFISRLEGRRRLLLCNRQLRSEFHINGNGKSARKNRTQWCLNGTSIMVFNRNLQQPESPKKYS